MSNYALAMDAFAEALRSRSTEELWRWHAEARRKHALGDAAQGIVADIAAAELLDR
jgi:hypothetical protein